MKPPTLRALAIGAHVSLAGFCYGLDTGKSPPRSIGPITQMSQFQTSIGPLSPTRQGVYVASILLASSLSSLLSGHVADALSRRHAIASGAACVAVGAVVSASAPDLAALIVARLVTGFGLGQAVSVATVFLVEVAPGRVRGVAACMLQTCVVLGIVVGYFTAFGSQRLSGSVAWRAPFVLQACCALVLAVGMAFVPFSPRWLVSKGRVEEARRVLARLREGGEVEGELEEIRKGFASHDARGSAGWLEMFRSRYAGRSFLAIFLMAFQQLTGIDVILYYAPIVFQQAGFSSDRASFLASGVSGIVMLAATVPAQIWIDRWGRRMPLVIGGSLMVACFFAIGGLYARFGERIDAGVRLTSVAGQWVVVVLIYIFVANFSWSWAVVGKIYSVEILPTRLRAKVSAVSLLANWLTNFAVALTAPLFLRASPSGPYFLFAATTLVAVIVCLGMPETKGRGLEEVEQQFDRRSIWNLFSSQSTAKGDSQGQGNEVHVNTEQTHAEQILEKQ